jgi:hydrogenase maturation protease
LERIAVIGVGNLLLKDDGVGIHAIRTLEELNLPPGIELFDCDTNAFLVLEAMDKKDRAVIIDAYKKGEPPGTITVLSFDPSNFESAPSLSLHEFHFVDALKSSGGVFDIPGDITIVGVEPKEVEVDDRLSPEVERVLPEVISRVLEIAGGESDL